MQKTIFDVLNSILYKKEKLSVEELDEIDFSPYVINNWLSTYNEEFFHFVNETLNRQSYFTNDKKRLYEYYYNVVPKLKFKKIVYPKVDKKKKVEEEISEESLCFLAEMLEIPKREVKYLIERNCINLQSFKK